MQRDPMAEAQDFDLAEAVTGTDDEELTDEEAEARAAEEYLEDVFDLSEDAQIKVSFSAEFETLGGRQQWTSIEITEKKLPVDVYGEHPDTGEPVLIDRRLETGFEAYQRISNAALTGIFHQQEAFRATEANMVARARARREQQLLENNPDAQPGLNQPLPN